MGAASLLSNQVDRGWASTDQRRVVIVGAGLAGLACAFELLRSGHWVTVMEARKRIGGRVLSFDRFIPDQIVEGGGELIGENHPTWWAYKEKFGLEFLEIPDDGALAMPILLEGRRLGFREGERLYQQMEKAFSSLTELARAIDADTPWLSIQAMELDYRSLADWLKGLAISDRVRKLAGIQLSSDNAVTNDSASLLGMLTAIKGGGLQAFWESSETHRCAGGNQQLAYKFAEEIGESHLLLDCPVVAIDYGGANVKVTGADGLTRECDDVVLAVPPSTWFRIQFSPSLPTELNPQMGKAIKYLAAVKRSFWRDDQMTADSLSDGLISQTWDATSGQAKRSSKACMVAFSGAAQADAGLSISAEHRDSSYRDAFSDLYPKFTDHFIESRMMNWPQDPWTMAGYSFPAPGQITSQGPLLRSGLGRLHFCGEYACYPFVGYMEGALHSGASLAKRIATSIR